MIIEFEQELQDFIKDEKSWNEVCAKIKQPMSMIAVALKKLRDIGEILEIVKDNNIYYKYNDKRKNSESIE